MLHDLDYEEITLAAAGPHPPVFACVMRRAGMPKQLECHGFICSSAEDAIIIAANLYQALVDTMKKNKNAGKVNYILYFRIYSSFLSCNYRLFICQSLYVSFNILPDISFNLSYLRV